MREKPRLHYKDVSYRAAATMPPRTNRHPSATKPPAHFHGVHHFCHAPLDLVVPSKVGARHSCSTHVQHKPLQRVSHLAPCFGQPDQRGGFEAVRLPAELQALPRRRQKTTEQCFSLAVRVRTIPRRDGCAAGGEDRIPCFSARAAKASSRLKGMAKAPE